MIKPQPKTYKCLSCNWSKTVSPQSDALSPLDYFDECPKCGEKKLKSYLNNIDYNAQGKRKGTLLIY
jgi:transcription elongation factor Elf1